MSDGYETCTNCGADVDKEPTVLCDDCDEDSEAELLRTDLANERLMRDNAVAQLEPHLFKCLELDAKLEAVTRERDRYKAALEHIVEHVQPGVAVNVAREALKGAGQ